jgi:hypothetical protein
MVRRAIVGALLMGFVSSALALAQEDSEQYAEVLTFKIRPTARLQFEDYMKKIVEAANKIGVDQTWQTSQMSVGGAGSTYMVALPFKDWGEMDSWTDLVEFMSKAHGEKEAEQIMRAGYAAIESYQSRIFWLRKDWTTKYEEYVKSEAPSKYVMVTEMAVNREELPHFQMLLSKTKAAEDKDPGRPMAGRWQCVLGPMPFFVTVRPFDKWGDGASWSSQDKAMRDMYGDAEAEQLDEMDLSTIASMHMYVLEYRPELSRYKASPATDN